MFRVQVVQRGPRGLQALRRCMELRVDERGLKVFAASTAVLSIARGRVNSVRVRRRLIKVNEDNGRALTVRLRDEEEALQAAQSMMETWDIDPLVEGPEVMQNIEEETSAMTQLAELYLSCLSFRQQIHEIHDHIDSILGDCYGAQV